jgi:hypothetical protein
MDPKYLALMVIASCAAGALIVWAISDALVRYAEIKRRKDSSLNESEINERLARIESAIEVMSIEVERIGETHRYALLPKPNQGRVITPH